MSNDFKRDKRKTISHADYTCIQNHTDSGYDDLKGCRSKCTGCDSGIMVAIKSVIEGKQACCPDCSTLTLDERNAIREAVVNRIKEKEQAQLLKERRTLEGVEK